MRPIGQQLNEAKINAKYALKNAGRTLKTKRINGKKYADLKYEPGVTAMGPDGPVLPIKYKGKDVSVKDPETGGRYHMSKFATGSQYTTYPCGHVTDNNGVVIAGGGAGHDNSKCVVNPGG